MKLVYLKLKIIKLVKYKSVLLIVNLKKLVLLYISTIITKQLYLNCLCRNISK